jgi:hypothetical protein
LRGIYGYIPLIFVLLTGLTGLAFYRPIGRWFKNNRELSIGAVVGYITHVEGSVRRMHGNDIELFPINQEHPIELRDGDKVQSGVSSKADFNMVNGGSFELPEGSGILYQRWDPKDEAGPVYMQILFGKVNGDHGEGEYYAIKNGKLFFAGQKESGEPLGLTIAVNTAQDKHFKLKKTSPASPVNNINPESLSLEYLNAAIATWRDELRGCWQPVKKAHNANAHMDVEFNIGRDGNPQNVKIVKASLEDEKFRACVSGCFERMFFRPFTGEPMTVTVPLEFL